MTISMSPAPTMHETLPGRLARPASVPPRITGVGTAVAGEPYSQQDLLDIFRITDPKVRSVFLNSAIERRYLSLPRAGR